MAWSYRVFAFGQKLEFIGHDRDTWHPLCEYRGSSCANTEDGRNSEAFGRLVGPPMQNFTYDLQEPHPAASRYFSGHHGRTSLNCFGWVRPPSDPSVCLSIPRITCRVSIRTRLRSTPLQSHGSLYIYDPNDFPLRHTSFTWLRRQSHGTFSTASPSIGVGSVLSYMEFCGKE